MPRLSPRIPGPEKENGWDPGSLGPTRLAASPAAESREGRGGWGCDEEARSTFGLSRRPMRRVPGNGPAVVRARTVGVGSGKEAPTAALQNQSSAGSVIAASHARMATTASAPPASPPASLISEAVAGRGFIAGRTYDTIYFILAPLLALGLVILVGRSEWASTPIPIGGATLPPLLYAVSVMTFAHLFAVVFRSHANPEIFALHRFRFVGVPILLFVGLMASDWVLATAAVLIVYWDIYHSSMQTFGLGRIYDARWGNDPAMGRRLDDWLNHVIYIGPLLAGASLAPMLQALNHFRIVEWQAPIHLRRQIQAASDTISVVVIVAGTLFVAYYLYRYWRFYREEGYRPSPQKIALLLSTAIASVWAWGFLTPWKALVAINLFHALQYFAIVWCREKKSIRRVLLVERFGGSYATAFTAFVWCVLIVGLAYQHYGDFHAIRWAGSLFIVVSLMHFWYDGFVWSVQKKQV